MAKQYGFFINVDRCSGCKTCVVACKDGHNHDPHLSLRKVVEQNGGDWQQNSEGAWQQNVYAYYVSLACNHCSDPACVKVCPTGAHFKNQDNGLVLIDQEKCIGCGACAQACPYGAPVLDTNLRKMQKCDGCWSRISTGRGPLCVEACPVRALEFGPIDELRAIYGDEAQLAPLPKPVTKPNIVIQKDLRRVNRAIG